MLCTKISPEETMSELTRTHWAIYFASEEGKIIH
jgi:hypothetical protein